MRLGNLIFFMVGIIFCVDVGAGVVPDSANDVSPLKVGEFVPQVILKDAEGKRFDLHAALAKKPTVMIFYRGSWCPYCNVHLGELKGVESELASLGYQIIAVSPDLPKNLQASMDKNTLSYTLVSDASGELIKALGLAFRVDDKTYQKYLGYNINLEKASGEKHHLLPVPAALIIDTKGKARFVFYSPDYKVRIKSEALLRAAKDTVR